MNADENGEWLLMQKRKGIDKEWLLVDFQHEEYMNELYTCEWEESINIANKDTLKELIDTTYTNKMHLLFSSLSLKNSTVKCVWLEVVME